MDKIYILTPVRTNNFIDLGDKIIAQWNKLLSLNLKDAVKYGIYFNYESNYKGNYDFSVGNEEEFSNSILKEVPNYKYRVFNCEQREVFEKWQEIWKLEEANEIERAYKFDYEKYLKNGKVEIYISIL